MFYWYGYGSVYNENELIIGSGMQAAVSDFNARHVPQTTVNINNKNEINAESWQRLAAGGLSSGMTIEPFRYYRITNFPGTLNFVFRRTTAFPQRWEYDPVNYGWRHFDVLLP